MPTRLSKKSLKVLNATDSYQLSVISFSVKSYLVAVPFAVSATETLFN